MEYNEKHGITPQTVRRAVQESLHTILRGREIAASVIQEAGGDFNLTELLRELEEEMQQASANLEFERAALAARSDHGSKKRHRPNEDRTKTQAGEIHPRRRPPPFAGLGDNQASGSDCLLSFTYSEKFEAQIGRTSKKPTRYLVAGLIGIGGKSAPGSRKFQVGPRLDRGKKGTLDLGSGKGANIGGSQSEEPFAIEGVIIWQSHRQQAGEQSRRRDPVNHVGACPFQPAEVHAK